MQPTTPTHPVEFDVDYPDRQLDRFSTILRPLFAIPILVVLAVLLDATLVRMVLVPATMSLMGRANWWLPGWLANPRCC